MWCILFQITVLKYQGGKTIDWPHKQRSFYTWKPQNRFNLLFQRCNNRRTENQAYRSKNQSQVMHRIWWMECQKRKQHWRRADSRVVQRTLVMNGQKFTHTRLKVFENKHSANSLKLRYYCWQSSYEKVVSLFSYPKFITRCDGRYRFSQLPLKLFPCKPTLKSRQRLWDKHKHNTEHAQNYITFSPLFILTRQRALDFIFALIQNTTKHTQRR